MNHAPSKFFGLVGWLLLIAGCGSATPPANSSTAADSGDGSTSVADDPTVPTERQTGPEAQKKGGAWPTPAKGARLLDRRTLKLDFDLNLSKNEQGVGIQSQAWSVTEERTLRIKDVAKGQISGLEVVYGKWEAAPLLDQSFSSVTNGQGYAIQSGSGDITVTRLKGTATPEETAAVTLEYGWVGGPSPLKQALLDTGLVPGSTVDSSPALALALYGTIPGVNSHDSTANLTLKSVDTTGASPALFDVTGAIKIKSKQTVFDVDLTGTVKVDGTTGWPLSIELTGVVRPSGQITHPKKGALTVGGKGKLVLSQTGETS